MPYRHVLIAALCLTAGAALAQQPTLTPTAVLPAQGNLSYQQLFGGRFWRGKAAEQFAETRLRYGLRHDVTLGLDLALYRREERLTGPTHVDFGLGDPELTATWRFYRNDFGPIDTTRAALLAGIEVPAGSGIFSSNSFDPSLGIAATHVQGRHGVNGAARYTLTTGGRDTPLRPGMGRADLLRLDASHLFRLAPAKYAADTKAAWYTMFEVQGYYETNGDLELRVAPGILYEAHDIAAEVSVQIPVADNLGRRPAQSVTVRAGFRLLF